jgi:hypothetical protein
MSQFLSGIGLADPVVVRSLESTLELVADLAHRAKTAATVTADALDVAAEGPFGAPRQRKTVRRPGATTPGDWRRLASAASSEGGSTGRSARLTGRER